MHKSMVTVAQIRRVYQELMPLPALVAKLRCSNCQARGQVDIDAAEALARR